MVNIAQSNCDHCGTCISVCAHDALKLLKELEVTESKCKSCGLCVKICPFGALTLSEKKSNTVINKVNN
jgi:ferredoxin